MRWWIAFLFLPGCIWITDADLAGFYDRDGDGVVHGPDCDDADPEVAEKILYYPDGDSDGYGDASAQPTSFCEGEQDEGYLTDHSDCDDAVADINPTGTEVCDNANNDENCNGVADDLDNDAGGKVEYYPDDDGDGYGDMTAPAEWYCDPPSGYETDNSDCDDDEIGVNPGEDEICDDADLDENCNGLADDDDHDSIEDDTLPSWYADFDDDGFGEDGVPLRQCDPPGGYVLDNTDCDDDANAINPGETEVCDQSDVDEDCNGVADNDDPAAVGKLTYYPDVDLDGFGDDSAVLGVDTVDLCDAEVGQVIDNTDCDDEVFEINPDATEVCDPSATDENCNLTEGDADPTLDQSTRTDWYPDLDGDTYGKDSVGAVPFCTAPASHVADNSDCNDNDPAINPGILDRPGDGDMNCDNKDYICGETMVRVWPLPNPDADYTSIQAAVNDVTNDLLNPILCDGDIIEVTPGLYNENLQIQDRSPIIIGTNGPGATTIHGNSLGRTVNMERTSATLEGFTILGGDTTSEVLKEGGGIRVFYGVDVVLKDLIVDGNKASVAGGIDINNPEDVQIIDVEIINNTATTAPNQNAGGIRIKAIGGAGGGVVLLDNVLIDGNAAGNQDGGVRISMGSSSTIVVIQNTVITHNTAINTGALGVRTAAGVEVYDTEISDNDGAAKIGGAFVEFSPALFDGVVFDSNSTGGTLSAFQASDLTGDIEFVDCEFTNNSITGNGYAILVKGSPSFGTVMNDVVIASNFGHFAEFFGGGVQLEGYADVNNVLVYDNTGFYGMLLIEEQVIPGPPNPAVHSVEYGTFFGNSGHGLDVAVDTALAITVKNVISSGNDEYGITNSNVSPVVVSYCDVFNNSGGGYSGVDQTGVNGNLNADPTFVNIGGNVLTWDFRLDPASPLIGAGESGEDMGYYGGSGAPP